jgi:hypothetical protein
MLLTRIPSSSPSSYSGFFYGVWPDGELQKIQWEDVKPEDWIVVINSNVSKTRRWRFIDVSENAATWLAAYRSAGGITSGSIARYSESELRTHRMLNSSSSMGIKAGGGIVG